MPWEVKAITQKYGRGLGPKSKQRDEVLVKNARKTNITVVILHNSCLNDQWRNDDE